MPRPLSEANPAAVLLLERLMHALSETTRRAAIVFGRHEEMAQRGFPMEKLQGHIAAHTALHFQAKASVIELDECWAYLAPCLDNAAGFRSTLREALEGMPSDVVSLSPTALFGNRRPTLYAYLPPDKLTEEGRAVLLRYERRCGIISAAKKAIGAAVTAVGRSGYQEHRIPLSGEAKAVRQILLTLRDDEGLSGKDILAALARRKPPIHVRQDQLTKRIVPELKPWGIDNKRRVGYFIKKSHRPDAQPPH